MLVIKLLDIHRALKKNYSSKKTQMVLYLRNQRDKQSSTFSYAYEMVKFIFVYFQCSINFCKACVYIIVTDINWKKQLRIKFFVLFKYIFAGFLNECGICDAICQTMAPLFQFIITHVHSYISFSSPESSFSSPGCVFYQPIIRNPDL